MSSWKADGSGMFRRPLHETLAITIPPGSVVTCVLLFEPSCGFCQRQPSQRAVQSHSTPSRQSCTALLLIAKRLENCEQGIMLLRPPVTVPGNESKPIAVCTNLKPSHSHTILETFSETSLRKQPWSFGLALGQTSKEKRRSMETAKLYVSTLSTPSN